MDHHGLLIELTTKQEGLNFDESLLQIINKIIPMLPEKIQRELEDLETTPDRKSLVRDRYLRIILFVLESLKNQDLSSGDTFLSTKQHATVKTAVEIVVSLGILPCLLPGIGAGIYKMCPRAKDLEKEELTDLQKYQRLSFAVRSLTDLFNEISLRSAILSQLGPLLGGLLQLSYAPLKKPSSSCDETKTSEFQMTEELYEELTKDQSEFAQRLSTIIEECPRATIVKELMIILGTKDAPRWIRKKTQTHLDDAITKANGILALVDAVCGDDIDFGLHWNKLDIVARLVAASHGQDPDKYYNAVCSQMVKLLVSKNTRHSSIIANNCIAVLYEENPEVCVEKIIRVITAPLRIEAQESCEARGRNEKEITECIDNLTNCFAPEDAKFKHPPCVLLTEVSLQLFHLYVKARRSVTSLRTKIRNILIHLMKESNFKDELFAAFLDHETKSQRYFGERISCKFGPTGGLEIVGKAEVSIDHEIVADSLFDLVAKDQKLSYDLFDYLLRSFNDLKSRKSQVLENQEDTFDRIGKQLGAMKLLSNLAVTREIQDSQIKNPQPILAFVKSMFDDRTSKPEDENIEVLYVSLMLIKIILTDNEEPKDWTPFDELATFLKSVERSTINNQRLLVLVEELLDVIKKRGKSKTRRYRDLSMDDHKEDSEFEKALKDLADPLLPVRAHGLIALTKLLEKKDAETVAKKDLILCFFQENLKDDDSFVYLSAVNGLCALATLFPDKVIETLVQEYIDMPQRDTSGEISPEVRAKLGEILVKTTRALGEMCTAYKTILINGFLCATRDPDDMVRASSLSCLGEICKVMGFQLGHSINEIIYCIGCIINTDKSPECRRAAVLVTNLLIRGLGRDVLTDLGSQLLPLYRALKFLRNNDDDQVLRLHAQLALEELDDIVKTQLFATPELEKRFFLPS